MPAVLYLGPSIPDLLALLSLETERQALVEGLSPLSFCARQADMFSLRVEGTGQWLLESDQFKSWLAADQSSTLWCSGIPGAGKTVLAAIVIDHLQRVVVTSEGDDVGIAFAYLSHQERIQQTPSNIMGSLLKQLVQDRPALCDLLKPLFQKRGGRNTILTLKDVSVALEHVIARHRKVFIVIDALDECPKHNGFRDVLLSELGSLSRHVNLLVTSRSHINIDFDIEGAARLEIQASEADLRKYLWTRITRANRPVRFVRPDDELKAKIVETLLGNAQGMFLLAQLHMDLIASSCLTYISFETFASGARPTDELLDE